MATKTTVTLPAGTVLHTSKSITVQGHTIEANATVTLGEEVSVDIGASPGNELPGRQPGQGGSSGSPDNSLPGQQPHPDQGLPPSGAQPKK